MVYWVSPSWVMRWNKPIRVDIIELRVCVDTYIKVQDLLHGASKHNRRWKLKMMLGVLQLLEMRWHERVLLDLPGILPDPLVMRNSFSVYRTSRFRRALCAHLFCLRSCCRERFLLSPQYMRLSSRRSSLWLQHVLYHEVVVSSKANRRVESCFCSKVMLLGYST